MADTLRPYLAVLTARFRMLLQYRAAAFAGFGTQLFWGAVRLMILGAFYASSQTESPMSLVQITAYVWLGQALLGLLPWNVDAELQEKMATGAVAYELLRPLDLYTFWFARTVALRTATTFLRMIPMIFVAGLVLPLIGLGAWALPPPASAVNALCFVVSLTATVALASVITMLMHVALIWTLSGRGFNAVMTGLVSALSGLVVPLPLYPDWMQPFLYWQPFRGLADVPFRIYSGNIGAGAAVWEIVMQFCWAGLIGGIGYTILSRAQARIVVQGG
ncbi:MAG: ABC-2 family transporter protein [Proteobacteria bacterium]|nr:ABC-2 family transporter protein [Pseudomonadota bacterium]